MPSQKARILIACRPQAYTRLFAILASHDLSFASTLGDAQAALHGDRFDMIMVGVHFDESKMFDLLQVVKADGRQGQARLVCFRGVELDSATGRILEANCQAACEAMGAAFSTSPRSPTTRKETTPSAKSSAACSPMGRPPPDRPPALNSPVILAGRRTASPAIRNQFSEH